MSSTSTGTDWAVNRNNNNGWVNLKSLLNSPWKRWERMQLTVNTFEIHPLLLVPSYEDLTGLDRLCDLVGTGHLWVADPSDDENDEPGATPPLILRTGLVFLTGTGRGEKDGCCVSVWVRLEFTRRAFINNSYIIIFFPLLNQICICKCCNL